MSEALNSHSEWKKLNATTIKLIAVVLMFLDHIHQMFVHIGAPIWLNMVGRLVFPMFLFISAESFFHTRNKKKYILRLLIASLCMTVFTFLLQRILPNDQIVLMNNAFGTFFVAALYMQAWDWFVDGIRNKAPKQIVKAVLFGLIPIVCVIPTFLLGQLALNQSIPLSTLQFFAMLSLLIPNILTVEGGLVTIALGVLFYVFRRHRFAQIISLFLVSALSFVMSGGIQWMMCFAAIPMLLYNGERGRGMKNFFYIFYPAHIGLLYIISTLAV